MINALPGHPTMMLALNKSLQLAAAVTAGTILTLYVPKLVQWFREDRHGQAKYLFLGIVLTWIGAAIIYFGLAARYLIQDIPVTPSARVSEIERVLYLLFFISGGAIHIAAAQPRGVPMFPTFCIWSFGMVIFCTFLTLFELGQPAAIFGR